MTNSHFNFTLEIVNPWSFNHRLRKFSDYFSHTVHILPWLINSDCIAQKTTYSIKKHANICLQVFVCHHRRLLETKLQDKWFFAMLELLQVYDYQQRRQFIHLFLITYEPWHIDAFYLLKSECLSLTLYITLLKKNCQRYFNKNLWKKGGNMVA